MISPESSLKVVNNFLSVFQSDTILEGTVPLDRPDFGIEAHFPKIPFLANQADG
jgi:hypothetical protein